MSKIKIAIVDDNRQTVISLKEMLTYYKEFEVVFSASNGEEFLDKMSESNSINIPQIVIMDIDMPKMDGIHAVSIAKSKYASTKFLILTNFDDEDKLFLSIQAGAHGYLLKDEKISVIADHIKNLLNNEATPMSPSIAKKTFEMLSRMPKPENNKDFIYENLSSREVEVINLMMEGYNYKIIAEKLFISSNTVKRHIAHIYEKLHVNSKAQILKLVLK